jgi:Beta xylosidase C-terminal Concanavalin A-like domain
VNQQLPKYRDVKRLVKDISLAEIALISSMIDPGSGPEIKCRSLGMNELKTLKRARESMTGRVAFLIVVVIALSSCIHDVSTKEPKPFSDNFTVDSTLKAGWILYEPNPASSFAIGSNGLLLEASGQNGGSDLWSGTNFRASLLLQPISLSADWTIITHFFFSLTVDFQAAGLILTMQPGDFNQFSKFHRFELSYQNRQNGLGIASYTNGLIDPPFEPYSGNEVYLKLTKVDATYKYYYSTSGERWTLVSTIIDASPYSYVGLDSIRQPWHGSPNLDSRPTFKSFCYLRAGEDNVEPACPKPIS